MERTLQFALSVLFIPVATGRISGMPGRERAGRRCGGCLRGPGSSLPAVRAWSAPHSPGSSAKEGGINFWNQRNVVDFPGGVPTPVTFMDEGVFNVRYPFDDAHPQHELARRQMSGGGTIVTFEIEGGRDEAFRFANALKLIDISNNLGDAKSLLTHPDTTTHARLPEAERRMLGITPGMFRLSVGLEDPLDLIDDISVGLQAAR